MKIDNLDSVLFDLDGTLIDSAPDVGAALNRLMAAEGRRQLPLDEVRRLVGEGAGVLIQGAFAVTGAPISEGELAGAITRYLGFYKEHPATLTRIYPGAVAALERLRARGISLGICTNKPHEMTGVVLAALDLARYFDAVVGGDAAPKRKPDRRHVEETLRRMGKSTARAAMVGDSIHDIHAARHAGIPVIAVSFGYAKGPASQLGADRVIDRFDDLDAALAALQEAAP